MTVKIGSINYPLMSGIKNTLKVVITIGIFLFCIAFDNNDRPSGYELIKTMISYTKQIDCLKYHIKKTERINKKFIIQESYIKYNRSPFKVYIKQLSPKKGMEIIYIQNENNNNAVIKPNGFPWINFNLKPTGKQMRKNQHHTIMDTGFDYFISILNHFFDKYGNEMEYMIENKGIKYCDAKPCWEVEIINPHFKYIKYFAHNNDETVLTVADKFKISELMILEKNNHIKNYSDILPAQKLIIPNDYSSKITLLIDKQKMVPIVITIEDIDGLFEKYEITKLEINPILKHQDFTFNN